MLTKKNIQKMLEMPDDKLAVLLKTILAASGADVSGLKLDGDSVRKLRAVLEEVTDEDLLRASVLMERYRRGG